jgi:hypothetical protein
MESEFEKLLTQEQRLFDPTAGMTRQQAEEYTHDILSREYYDMVETEDGLDCVSYNSDPAVIAEEEEEELIRLFGSNFNHTHN